METRYPVKGLYVWMPYGLKLRNSVFSIVKQLLEQTCHQEVLFPLLIPETLFEKEAEHIRGFGGQVYWVTKGGNEDLDVKLALRPTSETSMYPMFALWVRSHADLPVKIYQVVNIFRYETKMTKPLVRLREVTTFKEAHTAHATEEEAEAQVKEAVKIYRQFFNELGVPYTVSKRPPWDTFAGAKYSIAFDTLAPDGRTLQIGTVHNLGQNFSKVYGIEFEKDDGSHEHVHQTCYGISERAIAAVVMVHGDDVGLCLPPDVAPIQVVIVPIPYKEKVAQVEQFTKSLKEDLSAAGFRVHLDDRALRPGNKYYYWERRGVPLRVEVGPEEVTKDQVTVVPRTTGKRVVVSRKELRERTRQMLVEIMAELRERAQNNFRGSINEVSNLGEAKEIIDRVGGIIRVPWCGQKSCGKDIAEKTGGDFLGEELDGARPLVDCVGCSQKANVIALVARTY
ncbi:MAG: proline--tRNA ligase [Candidatus Hadarchaeota archaeon]